MNTATPSTTDTAPPRALVHDQSLEGLRAFAVAAVVGGHLAVFPGANNGVTLFFVLSGFLITALLVQEFDRRQDISLLNFYARRALRLLPALFAVLAIHLAFVLTSWTGYERKAAVAAAGATLFYSSNWVLAMRVFPMRHLSHTWSLAVEEQFYLLWPLLLLFALRSGATRRRLATVIGISAAALFVERLLLSASGATEARLYNGLDTRADALLIGAVIALVFRHRMLDTPQARRVLGWSGVASGLLLLVHLFAGLGVYVRSTSFACLTSYTAAAVLSGVVILSLAVRADETTAMRRVLEWTPIRYIGMISYGMYLWHYVLFAILDHFGVFMEGWINVLVRSALVVGVSAASYHLIEARCLQWKRYFIPEHAPRALAVAHVSGSESSLTPPQLRA